MKTIAVSAASFIASLVLAPSLWAASCPTKPQKIKVIDLKSGWWQGDGGDTDRYVVDHLKAKCPNITILYKHTLYGGGFGGGFGTGGSNASAPPEPPVVTAPTEAPVETADQIWLLSGGEADGADIRLNSPEFVAYLAEMRENKGNLFIGTGFGNVYHANAVTRDLGLGDLVLTDRQVHEYPSPSSGVRKLDDLTDLDRDHVLLKNLFALSNLVKIGEFEAPSDRLQKSDHVKALAKNRAGEVIIGEVKVGPRKIIIDANLARTYLIRSGDTAIGEYLTNLATALEN